MKKVHKTTSNQPLIDVIASNGCIQLLEPFLYQPRVEMYQSELIKKTRVPLNRGLKHIKALTHQGLLIETEKAGSKFYTVVEENPVLKQLKILIITSKLYELTRDYAGKNIELFLYGSAAKGEDTEHSDIDLLILASDENVAHELADYIRNHLDREVSPVIYTHIGYANLYNKEKAFYESIERYKIKVL